MIIKKKQILPNKTFFIDENLDVFPTPKYPISSYNFIKVKGEFKRDSSNKVISNLNVYSSINVFDSRDNSIFEYKFNSKEEFEIIEKEDGISDGYIIESDEIVLGDLIQRIIISNLPFELINQDKIYKETKKENNQEEKEYNSAFDILKDYKF